MRHRGLRSRFVRSRFEALEDRIVLSAAPPAVLDVAVASSQWTGGFYQHLQANQLGDGSGYSIPSGAAQDDSIPWLGMDRIRIKFSEDVFVDASDLSISGVTNASYEVADFDYDPQTDIAQWTLATPIGNDRIMLDLDAGGADPIRDLDGNSLDGEWTDGVSVGSSGDGIAGGDFQFSMQFLPGDAVNYHTEVETFSLWAVHNAIGQGTGDPYYVPQYDLDGNGTIEVSDWQYINDHLNETPPVGTPAAATSDAPTTGHFAPVSISDDAVDVAILLWDVFDDEEDTDAQLTYSVKSVSDPTLLDSYSIDPVTGTLIVNGFTPPGGGQVSGRTEVTVEAEDSSGQTVESTVTIDLHRTNHAPTLTASATHAGRNDWTISGWMTDPDDTNLDNFWVVLSGAFNAIVSVAEDGFYSYTSTLPSYGFSEVFISANDPQGLSAPPLTRYVGW